MIGRKIEAAAAVILASLAGLTVGYVFGRGYSLPWQAILLCAPVVWLYGGTHDEQYSYAYFWDWMTVGTAVLYGVYALAIMRSRIVGTICVVGFHAFFVVAFAATVLLFDPPT